MTAELPTEVVQRATQGERAALGDVLRRYVKPLHRLVRIALPGVDADEVTQAYPPRHSHSDASRRRQDLRRDGSLDPTLLLTAERQAIELEHKRLELQLDLARALVELESVAGPP